MLEHPGKILLLVARSVAVCMYKCITESVTCDCIN